MPVSRILCPGKPERLSFIWDAAHTTPHAANPHTSDEQSSGACLFGISARKVYPYTLLPMCTVVSYTTFSPLPRKRGGNFLWHCLSPAIDTDAYPLGSALLFAVRTFLQ